MRLVVGSCIVLLLVLPVAHVQALEPLALYDNFKAKPIDPDKWSGAENVGGSITEAIRQILFERLLMSFRVYARTDSDVGRLGGNINLGFTNPAAVTAVAATVQVNKIHAAGCATPGSAVTFVRVRLRGRFFNTGTPTPGQATNDVVGHIFIVSESTSPPDVLQVRFEVYRCDDLGPTCDSKTSLGSGNFGAINLGEQARLRVQWDPDNDRFIFQRDDQAEAFISYTVPDASPPGQPSKSLTIQSRVANCTAEPRPLGFAAVLFDNVFVNESATR